MRANAQPIADALVKEVAKPAKDALAEVVRSADLLDYTAEEGVRALGVGEALNSDSFPGQKRDKLCIVQRVPLGVVLAIPPFNYPGWLWFYFFVCLFFGRVCFSFFV